MNRLIRLVHFNLDDRKYALFLSAVIRVIRVVEITSLPKAPEIVAGVINLQGQVIPVFDSRASRSFMSTASMQSNQRRSGSSGREKRL